MVSCARSYARESTNDMKTGWRASRRRDDAVGHAEATADGNAVMIHNDEQHSRRTDAKKWPSVVCTNEQRETSRDVSSADEGLAES